MVEPISVGLIATTCALGMIKGLSGKAAGAGATKVINALRSAGTPEGREVLHATHRAFVRSIQLMAEACEVSGGEAADQFSGQALAALATDRSFTDFRVDGEVLLMQQLEPSIRAVFDGPHRDPLANITEIVIATIEARIDQQLTETHRGLFRHGSEKHRSWSQAFELFFSEQVKVNRRAFTALTFERLNEVVAFADAHASELNSIHQKIMGINTEMHGRFDRLEAIISEQAGVPLATMRVIAAGFDDELPPGADAFTIENYLRKKASEYRDLKERLVGIEARDNHTQVLLGRAQEAIDLGNFDEADSLIAAAEDLDEEVSRELRFSADQREIDRSSKRALRGQAAKLRGDYATAIAHHDAAMRMLPESAEELRTAYACEAALAAQEWGEVVNPAAMQDAIARWRALAASTDRSMAEETWAAIQNNLGVALYLSGTNQRGTHALTEAIEAFRAAMEVYTLERAPAKWAEAQTNLAGALRALGERKGSLWDLTESVAAYRTVLIVFERIRFPIEWARTQNNLGGALRTLGQVSSSTAALKEAVGIFNLALEVRVRDTYPLEWAMTLSNYATALAALGELTGDTAALRDAISAFRSTLSIFGRDRLPLYWAKTHMNLGKALYSLGEQSKDIASLDEANAAFLAALEVYSRDTLPMEWAKTRGSYGFALGAKARITRSYSLARAAVAVFEEVREVLVHANAALYLAATETGLKQARALRDSLRS